MNHTQANLPLHRVSFTPTLQRPELPFQLFTDCLHAFFLASEEHDDGRRQRCLRRRGRHEQERELARCIDLPRKVCLESDGDRLQERPCGGWRVVCPIEAPGPLAFATGSTPLRHFVRELPLEVVDVFLPPLALLDGEGDAFRCLRRAAREDACCPREQRLHGEGKRKSGRVGK